jgi:hypothetical protein
MAGNDGTEIANAFIEGRLNSYELQVLSPQYLLALAVRVAYDRAAT